jgi:hypothetical protein
VKAFGSTLKDAPNGAFFIRAAQRAGAVFVRELVNTCGAVLGVLVKVLDGSGARAIACHARHSRAGGNPERANASMRATMRANAPLDSRLRGNDSFLLRRITRVSARTQISLRIARLPLGDGEKITYSFSAVLSILIKSFMPKIPKTAPQVLSNEEIACAM